MDRVLNVMGTPALGWITEYLVIAVWFLGWFFVAKSTGFDPELRYNVRTTIRGQFSEPNDALGSFIGFCVVLGLAWLVLICVQVHNCYEMYDDYDVEEEQECLGWTRIIHILFYVVHLPVIVLVNLTNNETWIALSWWLPLITVVCGAILLGLGCLVAWIAKKIVKDIRSLNEDTEAQKSSKSSSSTKK